MATDSAELDTGDGGDMSNESVAVVYKIQRLDRLRFLLESIHAMQAQPVEVETVVVVESGAPVADRLPSEAIDRLVEVESAVLTHARNAGAEAASSEYVAFVDDDAYPDPEWAEHILDATEYAAAVGGPLYPDWRTRPLTWLPETWHWLIGCGPYYETAGLVPNTYGSNLVVERDAFLDVGGFDETIGMGTGVGQGAETELCRRLRRAGYDAVWYHPEARMNHIIQSDRTGRELLQRCYEQGLAKAAVGVAGRENRFVTDELAASVSRRPDQTVIAAVLTGLVGVGYLRGRVKND